jgi:hypothetical protein
MGPDPSRTTGRGRRVRGPRSSAARDPARKAHGAAAAILSAPVLPQPTYGLRPSDLCVPERLRDERGVLLLVTDPGLAGLFFRHRRSLRTRRAPDSVGRATPSGRAGPRSRRADRPTRNVRRRATGGLARHAAATISRAVAVAVLSPSPSPRRSQRLLRRDSRDRGTALSPLRTLGQSTSSNLRHLVMTTVAAQVCEACRRTRCGGTRMQRSVTSPHGWADTCASGSNDGLIFAAFGTAIAGTLIRSSWKGSSSTARQPAGTSISVVTHSAVMSG